MNEQNEDSLYEFFLNDAERPFSGWDFSSMADRMTSGPLAWSYSSKILPYTRQAKSLLDMGTGGGEFLASLVPLPNRTYATEGYPENVLVAKQRLEPLGVQVVETQEEGALPFSELTFELVINRHESYDPAEVFRVLIPGGYFITQQVENRNNATLRFLLTGNERVAGQKQTSFDADVRTIESVGFVVEERHETLTYMRIFDIGALVYYLNAIPWVVPGFSIQTHRAQLRQIHAKILETGYLDDDLHRSFLVARKPPI